MSGRGAAASRRRRRAQRSACHPASSSIGTRPFQLAAAELESCKGQPRGHAAPTCSGTSAAGSATMPSGKMGSRSRVPPGFSDACGGKGRTARRHSGPGMRNSCRRAPAQRKGALPPTCGTTVPRRAARRAAPQPRRRCAGRRCHWDRCWSCGGAAAGCRCGAGLVGGQSRARGPAPAALAQPSIVCAAICVEAQTICRPARPWAAALGHVGPCRHPRVLDRRAGRPRPSILLDHRLPYHLYRPQACAGCPFGAVFG